jgi:trans-aconitate 2-methyltransferase
MSDWDAAKYHRISDPQLAWGRAVASRLALVPGERLLDLGCGTGRLTTELAQTPGIRVVGLDRSVAMLEQARGQGGVRHGSDPGQTGDRPGSDWGPTGVRLGSDATQTGVRPGTDPGQTRDRPGTDEGLSPTYVRGDGAALPFVNAFDAIFSAAVFHWIPDHDGLFRSVYVALKPGGRLVAQCGGAGNLERLYGWARRLMRSDEYKQYFSGWANPNHFENVPDTERRLEQAGFKDIDVSLVISPVPFNDAEAFTEFVAAVCLRHHLDRLPVADRAPFLHAIAEQAAEADPPLTLDYWRLNIFGRKARA